MKKGVLGILFFFQVFFVFGQENSIITGTVVDLKTQKPLSNVVVELKNNGESTLTDSQGVFTLETKTENMFVLTFNYVGFTTKTMVLNEVGEKVDLGVIALEEDITSEEQLSLVTITDNDLGDDGSGSESTSGLLQASRDVYQQIAAFNWGQARFRIRGLDNEYGSTMVNGVNMNKLYDGRPQWSNWGGLNDATRNQEFTMGTAASDYTFGGILGTQEINTRASHYRPGLRITQSATNTNYSWRTMATYASGLDKDGWAYTISASRRWAQEGHFEGTDYSANSLFASIEKKINNKHSLNFTSIYAQNSRGKSAPLTDEVADIMGVRYNSYWGNQAGRKRNSRDKDVEEPIFMLTHYWQINDDTKLQTNVTYQTGTIANSRLEFPGANNPDPTYYKNLPSYFINLGDTQGAADALDYFKNNAQINWNNLYSANQATASGNAAAVLTDQVNADNQISFNSILGSRLSDNIYLNAAANFKKLSSHNYAEVTDLLGSSAFLNVDNFFTGQAAQFDLNNPNALIGEGGKFGYNYKIHATVADAFTQFKFNYKKVDFYLAQSFSRTQYEREGLFRNGIYANSSYGKIGSKTFENFGFKGGLTYRLTGRQMLDFNGAYMTAAPTIRSAFPNARRANAFTGDLQSKNILSADANYIVRAPGIKARLSGFYSRTSNGTDVSFYYAEDIAQGNEGNEDTFVAEILTGVATQNMGAELGLEVKLTPTFTATAAASYGQYTYVDNANLKTNDDDLANIGENPITDFGTAYIKDYKQAGVPQQALSFGIDYRDPNYWWVGANINYLSEAYTDFSAIMRTDNFTIDPSTGVSYAGATEESVRALLKQEKLDPVSLVNLKGGKSWLYSRKNRNTIGFFAMVNNVFDVTYKTGGFEQSRKATFPALVADNANGTPSFGPKYFYGYGRTFFVNLYINF